MCLGCSFCLCGIRLCIRDHQTADTVLLRRRGHSGYTARTPCCAGALIFGGLPPGEYLLSLHRQGQTLPLLVRLSPGANVNIACRLDSRQFHWRMDMFHYDYNAAQPLAWSL